ncbi:hypothetical protein QTG54_008117 [Skeletonema marinoi]|uniref:Uncharacterized protein n=1 Tax=Skeletonema marinoi TaxID=267567 RepID=A0AAD9DCN3_9STRA|nr:hypothetical protein QTG54_008117 [Skeletonema marinoi]
MPSKKKAKCKDKAKKKAAAAAAAAEKAEKQEELLDSLQSRCAKQEDALLEEAIKLAAAEKEN